MLYALTSLYIEGEQTWVLGLINIENNAIRLAIIQNRTEATLKLIIEKHFGIGNTVYMDSWPGINFLHQENSGYSHNFINHGNGIFGLTSRIEGLWSELKI